MRIEKNGNRYFSFQELLGEPTKRKTDTEKQARFCKRHKCKACGQPMDYVGGNVMTCCNPKCKGIKMTKLDKEGNEKTVYLVSYDILDETGAKIAQRIFE